MAPYAPPVRFLEVLPRRTESVSRAYAWSCRNDFFISTKFSLKPSARTLPVGIIGFSGVWSIERGLLSACVVESAAPIAIPYLAVARHFVAGLAAGALKD